MSWATGLALAQQHERWIAKRDGHEDQDYDGQLTVAGRRRAAEKAATARQDGEDPLTMAELAARQVVTRAAEVAEKAGAEPAVSSFLGEVMPGELAKAETLAGGTCLGGPFPCAPCMARKWALAALYDSAEPWERPDWAGKIYHESVRFRELHPAMDVYVPYQGGY
jgi:hypothetical protein